MELLISKHPLISGLRIKSTNDCFRFCIENADQLNIATGYITNDSIYEVKQYLEYRNHSLSMNLFVGMHYLEGFTKLQYNAVRDLSKYLTDHELGKVYLSPNALYHGKMYSLSRGSDSIGSFVGSSNLGSFIGTSRNLIESDVFFDGIEANIIQSQISSIISTLGVEFKECNPITKFLPPSVDLFNQNDNVQKVDKEYVGKATDLATGPKIKIRLKTTPKSNLNVSQGAGKVPNKFTPRDWYEVEVNISTKTENRDLIPWNSDKELNEQCAFFVITDDGYKFKCSRQGQCGKNLRSTPVLRILGRWIKGRMENEGVIKNGEVVTEETLNKFGKHFLVLQKTFDDNWLLTME